MIISRTPFRISFFGGGTDYPAWYRTHGGSVLATTINKYCYLSCRYLPPFFEHKIRLVYSKIENCMGIDEIQHQAVREILRYQKVDRGVEIHHDGDLPARSGIGSSSAFTIGLLHAVHALLGRMPTKPDLAREGIYIEQEVLKETVGSQDQVLVAYGGFNHISFLPNGEIRVRPITIPAERVAELNDHLMLFYTGIRRTASEIARTYVEDLERREGGLRSLNDMVAESLEILGHAGDIRPFGKLLDEAWRAKRSLSATVSNAFVDTVYEAAISAGAIGGKLLGAGGGGFVLFFVPPGDQKSVRERLRKLIYVPFRFESSGSQIIFFDREEDHPAEEWVRPDDADPSFDGLSS